MSIFKPLPEDIGQRFSGEAKVQALAESKEGGRDEAGTKESFNNISEEKRIVAAELEKEFMLSLTQASFDSGPQAFHYRKLLDGLKAHNHRVATQNVRRRELLSESKPESTAKGEVESLSLSPEQVQIEVFQNEKLRAQVNTLSQDLLTLHRRLNHAESLARVCNQNFTRRKEEAQTLHAHQIFQTRVGQLQRKFEDRLIQMQDHLKQAQLKDLKRKTKAQQLKVECAETRMLISKHRADKVEIALQLAAAHASDQSLPPLEGAASELTTALSKSFNYIIDKFGEEGWEKFAVFSTAHKIAIHREACLPGCARPDCAKDSFSAMPLQLQALFVGEFYKELSGVVDKATLAFQLSQGKLQERKEKAQRLIKLSLLASKKDEQVHEEKHEELSLSVALSSKLTLFNRQTAKLVDVFFFLENLSSHFAHFRSRLDQFVAARGGIIDLSESFHSHSVVQAAAGSFLDGNWSAKWITSSEPFYNIKVFSGVSTANELAEALNELKRQIFDRVEAIEHAVEKFPQKALQPKTLGPRLSRVLRSRRESGALFMVGKKRNNSNLKPKNSSGKAISTTFPRVIGVSQCSTFATSKIETQPLVGEKEKQPNKSLENSIRNQQIRLRNLHTLNLKVSKRIENINRSPGINGIEFSLTAGPRLIH